MTIPKPLLPLGDTPVLDIVLRQLARDGFDRVVLALGHMAPVFHAHFGDGSGYGLSIRYLHEDAPLGTAGALRALSDVPPEFLVMNGDILTDLSFSDLVQAHRRAGASATIGVVTRKEVVDYGVIELSEAGAFLEYREKPSIPYHVSMGINVLTPEAIALIPPVGRFDMPQLMQAVHDSGRTVYCHRCSCYWQDMGRFDDYTRASEDYVRDPDQFLKAGTGTDT